MWLKQQARKMIFAVICQVQQWQCACEVSWGELELSCCLESWHGGEWGILNLVLVQLSWFYSLEQRLRWVFKCVCKGVRVGEKFPLAESLSQYCKSLISEITNWLIICETTLVKANFNGEFQGSFKIHTLIMNLKQSCFSSMLRSFFFHDWWGWITGLELHAVSSYFITD